MAALTRDRNTPQRAPVLALDFVDPVAAGVKIHAGALVVLDASGHAAPATAATGLTARGVAQEQVDNTAGGAGDATVRVRAGIWRLDHDGTIGRAEIGKTAYLVDDQTVAADDGGGTRSAAGTIVDVDADGVWVRIGI